MDFKICALQIEDTVFKKNFTIFFQYSATSNSTESPVMKSSTPVRKTGLRSLESTPSSSSGSLNSLNPSTRAPPLAVMTSGNGGSFDLSSPIYQCASLHESRAKTLCRKQPQRMLEHTQGMQTMGLCTNHVDIILGNFNPPPPMQTLLLNSYQYCGHLSIPLICPRGLYTPSKVVLGFVHGLNF